MKWRMSNSPRPIGNNSSNCGSSGPGGSKIVVGVEPGALVSDADVEPLGGHGATQPNLLVGVHLVAVPDRVDQGFFERQLDGEGVAVGVRQFLERFVEKILGAACPGEIAGEGEFEGELSGAHIGRLSDLRLIERLRALSPS